MSGFNGNNFIENKRTDDNNSHLCEKLFESDNDQRRRSLENNTNRIDIVCLFDYPKF